MSEEKPREREEKETHELPVSTFSCLELYLADWWSYTHCTEEQIKLRGKCIVSSIDCLIAQKTPISDTSNLCCACTKAN